MIGQHTLLGTIDKYIDTNTLPRFLIVCGERGSGKKQVVNYLVDKANVKCLQFGTSINDVRTIIDSCYKVQSPTIYFIPDADGMSTNAKNALLKVTEEPPNKAYIVMTVEDINNMLDTIRSRATILNMDRYSASEITEYAGDIDIIVKVCQTPGQVDMVKGFGTKEFYDYVKKVIDNLETVSIANIFKVADKVALKEEAEGYDLKLFWQAFNEICLENLFGGDKVYAQCIKITSYYLSQLNTKSINKTMLFDNWLMEVKQAWT